MLLNILLFETINIKTTIIHALNNAAGVMNPNYNYSGEITYLQIGFTLIFISIFYIPFLFINEYKQVKE